ncbi:MAG: cobalt ECF transporter T component CbiQ [Actinobacteria bacterium]|nr:cobalt ECF transporter T component CbiQ [Actinomycetota bacterium]
MIPEWLKSNPENISYSDYNPVLIKKRNFIDKTINALLKLLKEFYSEERYSQKDGLLQTVNPEIKIATMVFFLIYISLTRKLEILILFYLLTLSTAFFSKIKNSFFIKRVWFFIPLFSGIIALPSMFNLITPGRQLLVLYHLNEKYFFIPQELAITKEGFFGALVFVSRVAVSVSMVVLLTLTTKWNDLFKALKVFKIPDVFILVFGMTFRYILMFIEIVKEMHLAYKSRLIGALKVKENQRWIASQIAFVFNKSFKMSNDVYLAMVSRGFTGEVKTLSDFKIKKVDVLWISGAMLIGFLAKYLTI